MQSNISCKKVWIVIFVTNFIEYEFVGISLLDAYIMGGEHLDE